MHRQPIDIPDFMRYEKGVRESSHVLLLRSSDGGFDPADQLVVERFNQAISHALDQLEDFRPNPPVLLKVHIGEPRNQTAMRPEMTAGVNDFLIRQGCHDFFYGDTTVLYTGPRGYRQNGPLAKPYLDLARQRGWTDIAPFVVLDRPQTCVAGKIEFSRDEIIKESQPKGRFKRFFLSGGFAASGSVINHVHLTLHGLAHLALSVKGLTMGLATRNGKLAMHQSYHPYFEKELCIQCGGCIEGCPEKALLENTDNIPAADTKKCIGCGECVAVCPENAIVMQAAERIDWTKGSESLPRRMADYLMGLMDGRWEDLINIAHVYNITSRCDCVDEPMEPICENLGFIIGRNPFAVDRAARRWLEENLHRQSGKAGGIKNFYSHDAGCDQYEYVSTQYGVITEPKLIPIEVKVNP